MNPSPAPTGKPKKQEQADRQLGKINNLRARKGGEPIATEKYHWKGEKSEQLAGGPKLRKGGNKK